MLKIVEPEAVAEERNAGFQTLDELAREGARRMISSAMELEVAEYIERNRLERDEQGRALVVRNGRAKPRKLAVGSGTFEVSAPRVNDKRPGERFTSRILPPYMRKSPKVAEVIPVLYLRGLSTGDFREALPILLGKEASGLSPTTIARMTNVWQDEYREFRNRSLADKNYLYVWVDGIHFNVRLEEDRLCTLVVMGALPDGTKEPIAIEDGYRESKESWKSVLEDLKRRGMRAPLIVTGDGALGFWAAARDVWPDTKGQRCWVHKIANILDKLPKRLQPKAKELLHEAMNAATRDDCHDAMADFEAAFGAKYPKAVTCLQKDKEALTAFYDFPAQQWVHLRTSNPIESTFATVRLRQRVTKGAGTRNKALLMAFKLILMASKRWRRLSGNHLMADVANGCKFVDGIRESNSQTEDETNTDDLRENVA